MFHLYEIERFPTGPVSWVAAPCAEDAYRALFSDHVRLGEQGSLVHLKVSRRLWEHMELNGRPVIELVAEAHRDGEARVLGVVDGP